MAARGRGARKAGSPAYIDEDDDALILELDMQSLFDVYRLVDEAWSEIEDMSEEDVRSAAEDRSEDEVRSEDDVSADDAKSEADDISDDDVRSEDDISELDDKSGAVEADEFA